MEVIQAPQLESAQAMTPRELREAVLAKLAAGVSPVAVAAMMGIEKSRVYNWRAADRERQKRRKWRAPTPAEVRTVTPARISMAKAMMAATATAPGPDLGSDPQGLVNKNKRLATLVKILFDMVVGQ